MPLGEAMRRQYGAPYWTVHRADLQTILLDAVRGSDHIRLAFGRTVAEIEDNSGSSVTIRCDSQSASERVTGKALIGADGIGSNVARLMGDLSRPEFRRHIAWRGLVARKDWPADLAADETGLWLGPGAHLVHYPIRRGEFINLVAVTSDHDNQPGWSRAGEPSVLQKRFSAWHPDALRAIKAAQEWNIWSLFDRPPRTKWLENRVVLLGDAAHPVLPFLAQGGALAIEDAQVLSAELSKHASNPTAAFAAYAELRQQRSAKIQAAARRNGDIYHMRWPLSIGRDLTMSRMNLADHYSWIYHWHYS
jgi:salicylate hydroxylase